MLIMNSAFNNYLSGQENIKVKVLTSTFHILWSLLKLVSLMVIITAKEQMHFKLVMGWVWVVGYRIVQKYSAIILFRSSYLPRLPSSPLGRHTPPNQSLRCSTPVPTLATSWNNNYPWKAVLYGKKNIYSVIHIYLLLPNTITKPEKEVATNLP